MQHNADYLRAAVAEDPENEMFAGLRRAAAAESMGKAAAHSA
jgi:hypothetical protein